MRILYLFLPILLGFSLHAKENATCYLFKQIDLVVDTSDLKDKNPDDRWISYHLHSKPEYTGSIWCYLNKNHVYDCLDTDGKVKIKNSKNGILLYPEFIITGKEVLINGEPDLDRIIIEHKTYIKGVKTPCQSHKK